VIPTAARLLPGVPLRASALVAFCLLACACTACGGKTRELCARSEEKRPPPDAGSACLAYLRSLTVYTEYAYVQCLCERCEEEFRACVAIDACGGRCNVAGECSYDSDLGRIASECLERNSEPSQGYMAQLD
jgi:hypothetical protein